jgi:hypothetical protein
MSAERKAFNTALPITAWALFENIILFPWIANIYPGMGKGPVQRPAGQFCAVV